ncbi:MAG: hypothetical protein ORN85_09655 [Sediminibacterium sp.]|nr:hypothetical protein [Sediminibacterium sp.]
MKKLVYFSITLAIFAFVYSCQKSTSSTAISNNYDCSQSYSYTTDIAPILNASCALVGCHNASSRESGYDFSSYTAAKSYTSKINAIIGSMNYSSGYKPMPQGRAQLSTATIQKIYCWYANGTPQ